MLLKKLLRSTTVAAFFLATLTATAAHADWYYPLVRITCVPEAHYAAVETFGLYNIGSSVTPVPAELAAQGIYKLRSLVDKPVTCELPQGRLVIELFDYHAPRATGMCGGVEDAALRVLLAGSEIAVTLSTHGGCGGSERHDIRVSEYEVHHCILAFEGPTQVVEPGDFTPIEATCRNTPLPR